MKLNIDKTQLALNCIQGGIWSPQPVTEQPHLTLSSWHFFKLLDEALHLCGYCIENREGRISSKVTAIDHKSRMCTTQSGRLYKLVGNAGNNSDADYVKGAWLRIANIARDDIENLYEVPTL